MFFNIATEQFLAPLLHEHIFGTREGIQVRSKQLARLYVYSITLLAGLCTSRPQRASLVGSR